MSRWLLAFALLVVPLRAHADSIEGYAWPTSVVQGDSISICVSTDAPTFMADVFRVGADTVRYAQIGPVTGVNQPIPAEPWLNGCNWLPSIRLYIPPTWPSGVYIVNLLPSAGTATGGAIFTVKENQPGSTGRILFQTSVATWQAYNNWGGKCLYDSRSSGGHRSHAVSFKRPYPAGAPMGEFFNWEYYCAKWLEEQGYGVEYCTDVDTHYYQTLEDNYDLFLVVGHDEYWSLGMRDNLEGRLQRGGHLAFLGGNSCWFQVRYTPALDKIICYKDRCTDPAAATQPATVTIPWWEWPVDRPENPFTGLSWRNGGYVNAMGWFDATQGYGGYTAYNTNHWLFEGTGVTEGTVFGRTETIVGPETDGTLFIWQNNRPLTTGGFDSPLNYRILGVSPASFGYATMGMWLHPSGANVFNAATIRWSNGLATDPVVARITHNMIIAALGEQATVEGAVVTPVEGALRVYPSPAASDIRFEWPADQFHSPRLRLYGVDGRLVAKLPVHLDGVRNHAIWDGRGDQGARCAPGVYMAQLEGSSRVTTSKVLLTR